MNRRTAVPLLALAAAGCYAIAGAIEVAHDQPTAFASPLDYWLEAAFVVGLLASVSALAVLSSLAPRRLPAAAWGVAAAGNAGICVAALATAVRGRESLDLLFSVGFLLLAVGYLTLALLDLRGRVMPARAGVVLLGGIVVAAVIDQVGAGSLALTASWVAVAALTRVAGVADAGTGSGRRGRTDSALPRST